MAPIVVPGVTRFAVNQQIGGQDVVNIVDMQVDTTGSQLDRGTANLRVAEDILDNWDDHILGNLVAELSGQNVSWLDLNSLDGNVGVTTVGKTTTWPKAGGVAGFPVMPAMIALRVNKATSGGRGTRQGRMYLAGASEDWTATGVSQSFTAAIVASWNGFLQLFLNGINDAGISAEPQRQMVVVHDTITAAPSFTEVTGLTADSRISTQVRRGSLR